MALIPIKLNDFKQYLLFNFRLLLQGACYLSFPLGCSGSVQPRVKKGYSGFRATFTDVFVLVS